MRGLAHRGGCGIPYHYTQRGPFGVRARLTPCTKETGSRNCINTNIPRTAAASKPPGWKDNIHELDGGDDEICPRPLTGQALLREELHSMMVKDVLIKAWADVSNK